MKKRPRSPPHTHTHTHLHPSSHSFFILKSLGFRGRRRVLLLSHPLCLRSSVSTWQTRLSISSCRAGRRLHSDCKFHVLSIRPSTPLSICFPRAAIRPSSRTWMCYNDSLSSYFTLRSVSFVLFFLSRLVHFSSLSLCTVTFSPSPDSFFYTYVFTWWGESQMVAPTQRSFWSSCFRDI